MLARHWQRGTTAAFRKVGARWCLGASNRTVRGKKKEKKNTSTSHKGTVFSTHLKGKRDSLEVREQEVGSLLKKGVERGFLVHVSRRREAAVRSQKRDKP